MTIATPRPTFQNLSRVFFDKEMIKQIAIELVANQAEAFVELTSDFPGEYGTFAEVKGCIEGGVRDSTIDYAADLLAEFEELLCEAIRAMKVNVSAAKFGVDGVVDVDVSVGIE